VCVERGGTYLARGVYDFTVVLSAVEAYRLCKSALDGGEVGLDKGALHELDDEGGLAWR
jgi:hypothetical protein